MSSNKTFSNGITKKAQTLGSSSDATSSSESKVASNWSLDRMPPCTIPPNEEFSPVEHYVTVAITSRSNLSGEDPSSQKLTSDLGRTSESSTTSSYLSGYQSILDCIRKRNDPPMLWKILLALRSRSLSMVATNPSRHAHLLHVIMKLDAYKPPKCFTSDNNSNNNAANAKKVLNLISNEEAIQYFTDFTIADAYLHLLVGLVSANSIFLVPCLESMWKNIISDPKASYAKTSRLHSALATTLRLVPKAHTELFPIISRNIPYRRAQLAIQEWYANQSLSILRYQPDLHEEILRLLIEKCLEIDVEIKVDFGGKVSIEEKEDEEMFDLDMDETEIQKKKMDESKLKEKVEVDEMAERLDTLLIILMNHIQKYSDSSNQAVKKLFGMLFRIFNSTILTTHRSKYVQFLMLYICAIEDEKSKNIENALTLHADIDNRIYRQFAAQLINNLVAPGYTPIERQSSVCYLASFVARSSYISPCTICESIEALLRWGDAYVDSYYDISMDKDSLHIGSKTGADQQLWKKKVETHAVFYNVCQAAFYIMCFRGKEAMEFYHETVASHRKQEDGNHVDLVSVDIGAHRWEKLCSHEQLQPLKFCLESVRREFMFIAKVFHLLPRKLLEMLEEEDEKMAILIAERQARLQKSPGRKVLRRRSISTPATLEKRRLRNAELRKKGGKIGGGVGGLGKGSNPLDSFFPFDPCLLRLSHGFIEPYYIDWDGGLELKEDIEQSDDDQSDDESSSISTDSSQTSSGNEADDFDDQDVAPMSFSSVAPKLEFEIEKMKRMRAQSIGSGSW